MKRRVVCIVLLLVAGAIVNVAVAWACMVGVNINAAPFRWSLVYYPPAHYWSVTARDIAGRSERKSDVFTGSIRSNWPESPVQELITNWGRVREPAIPQIESLMQTRAFAPAPQLFMQFVDEASGWPCLSFWQGWGTPELSSNPFATYATPPSVQSDRWSIVIDAARQEALPVRPIWPGFAINTLFYAGTLWGGWLLFAAPFALRRCRRIKRGLCPACAYPVGDSDVCTECGSPVKPRRGVGVL